MENVRKLITEADGYQPHLIAPEQGYRRLIESSLVTIRGPAEAAVDAVCIQMYTIVCSYYAMWKLYREQNHSPTLNHSKAFFLLNSLK